MSRILYVGDTLPLSVLITTDNLAYNIPSNATVRASLVSIAGRHLAGPWLIADPNDGSWTQGLVVVPIDGEQTKNLDPQGCRIEVEIQTGGTSITRQTNETISLRLAGIGTPQTLTPAIATASSSAL